ncbi:mitogen-activated protein kinase-binding protein 1-like isoform X3 [Bolinopsis microptera]|uniref:mitogen-activated protein kinase-binding protein 1-like isoform X3 n=1 Tax=Bolinopsis microptera TaxID=2820187 RepID=UPI0030795873
MVKRSGTYTKDISTLSKDAEKENVPKPVVKTVRRPSNAGSNLNEKRTLARQQSKGKQEDGTQLKKEKSVLRKRANNYVRRGQKDQRSDRFARHAYAFLDRVKLEQVLGVSATSNNSLSYDPNTENILYTAGCVCVLYNIKKSKQTHIKNVSKKPLTCAAFSRDGAYVVTGESGHQPCVRVWDANSQVQIKELRGHRFGISSVNFSPNGKVVVSVGFTHDSNVSVWNWKTGKQVAGNKVSSRVFGMSFNEKGTYFVTVGIRFVKFWYFNSNDDKALNQLSPCENRAAILDNHRNTTFKSVICGKGQFSHLTFCLSNEGSLYSFGESRRVERWLDLKVNDAFALYVTNDHLLCGCSDGVVRVFEPASLTHIVNLPKPHPLGVDLASCTSPSCMVSVLPSSEFPDCIGVVADSLTSKVIVLYRDKSLYIWDIANIHRVGKYRSYLFHSACICAIEVYPQESENSTMSLPKGTFITGSSDNTIKIWNLNTLDPEEQVKTKRNIYSKELLSQIYTTDDFSWLRARRGNAVSDNASGITALAISPRGDVVASGDKSGNIRVYDLEDLSCRELAMIIGHEAEILSLSFTRPDNYWHYLVSASRDRLIHVFDVRKGYELVQTICDHSAIVTSVKFVEKPNDSQLTLLSCSADKSVRFRTGFKTGSHQLQFQTYQHVQEKSTFNDMEIPQSRDRVITGCQDRQIRTYDLSSGKLLNSFKSGSSEDGGMITNVALDPSSTYLAAAGNDKSIFVHDLQSGDRLASLHGHSEMITGLKFTNDCKRLISISGDGCIFVWRLSNEVVKNIRTKMRGQGFEPEISAETPIPNKKGEAPTSPHCEYAIPIMDLISDTKTSEASESQLADTSTTEQSTPEKKRKQWAKPSNLNFLDEITPNEAMTPCTPANPAAKRTAPDGGEHVHPDLMSFESPKIPAEAEPQEPLVTEEEVTVEVQGGEVGFEEEEEEEEDEASAEDDSEPVIIYAPAKVFSPNAKKRLSAIFDVNVTPQKARTTSENTELTDEDEDDQDTTFQGELDDVEEEEIKSDSFLKHKFSEIDEEFDDLDLDLPSDSLSPNSRHRQSISRKFYKSSTPEKLKANINGHPETPRSKGSSPLSNPGSPDRVRSDTEISSGKNMAALAKTASESTGASSDRSFSKSAKDDKKAAGKVKGKNKLKLAFGGKTKEEKKEIKKEEKLEKAAAKKTKKEAAAPKKEVAGPKKDTPDQITSLHTAFKDSLSKYDEILAEKPSASRDDQLSKLNLVYKDMLADLQRRLKSSDNMASAGGASEDLNNTPAEHHAAKCAEICAEKILELVQQKLQNGNLV